MHEDFHFRIIIQNLKICLNFGSGDPVKSLHKVKIPASIRNQDIFIEGDVVDNDIPMLLSKSAMKKANTSIDFQSNTVTMLGQKQQVIITTSEHYAIPSGKNQQTFEGFSGES